VIALLNQQSHNGQEMEQEHEKKEAVH